MKIGLIDVDGHNFPNIALMKISEYHKSKGDTVEWVNYLAYYDTVYLSKVFTFSSDNTCCINADNIVKGGTGYNINLQLPVEIDNSLLDYSIYPNLIHAYGFLTRGCINKCNWCIVPQKEGAIKPYKDIDEILQGKMSAVLMDNNILSCEYGIKQLEKIIDKAIKIDLNQGIDARLITDDVAKLLSKIKWIRYIRLACDTEAMLPVIQHAVRLLGKYGIKSSKLFIYTLLNDLEESYNRINALKAMNVLPFAQPFRSYNAKNDIPQWQLDMARWVNMKAVFKTVDFKNYTPRKGFTCNSYFSYATTA